MMRLVKDPLLHVLIAGVVIYALYAWAQPAPADDNLIVVDESALATFIVKRTAVTDVDAAKARLRTMSKDELDLLIKDLVREQALLQEALRLGFDQDDYVMERRLVQRLEFALLALATSEARPSESELRAFYDTHRNLYETPARITFTHVYLNPEERGEATLEDAQSLLRTLREEAIDFAGAMRYGDRFLYHRNYVERPFEDIASHFGKDMAEALFTGALPVLKWSGPHASAHGSHLALVRELDSASTPPFEAVRAAVERDYARASERESLDQAVQRIIDRQRVRIDFATMGGGYE